MIKTKIDIVIVTLDKYDFLRNLIESILDTSDYDKYDINIIVVINGIPYKHLYDLYDIMNDFISFNISYVFNKENLGCSRSRNIGSNMGKGDYILFLDDDTLVSDGFIDSLLEGFIDETVGVVGLKSVDENDLITGGGFINPDRISQGRKWKVKDFPGILDEIEEVVYVNGACFCTPRKVFESIGGFNENLFFWYEDSWYCLEIKEKLGLKTIFNGKFKIIHYCNSSSKSKKCMEELNISRKIFKERWGVI